MKPVSTERAPKAIGPYSQGMRCGDLVFFSGQIPLDPATGEMVGNNVQAQTEQVMRNIEGLLHSLGLSFHHLVKTTVFLKNIQEFAAFNEVYASFLSAPFPARSTIEVAALPKGALVEIECIACLQK